VAGSYWCTSSCTVALYREFPILVTGVVGPAHGYAGHKRRPPGGGTERGPPCARAVASSHSSFTATRKGRTQSI